MSDSPHVTLERLGERHLPDMAARAGYVREGVVRSIHVKDGVRRDAELWSRLPSDDLPA